MFLTQLFLKENKEIFNTSPITIGNVVTLSAAFSLYLSPYSTKYKDKFL